MAKINKTSVYPIKLNPTMDDYFIGTNNATYNKKTVNFKFQSVSDLIFEYIAEQLGIIGYPSGNAQEPDGLISGGLVTWSGTSYIFDVSSAVFRLSGQLYYMPSDQITLQNSDPTNPRLDTVYVSEEGFGTITGIPAPTPSAPQVDLETQIFLTNILVPENTSSPVDYIQQDFIYKENEEWKGSTEGVGQIDFESTTSPYEGQYSIHARYVQDRFKIIMDKGSVFELKSEDVISFKLKLKSALNINQSLWIGVLTDGNYLKYPLKKLTLTPTITSYQSVSIQGSEIITSSAAEIIGDTYKVVLIFRDSSLSATTLKGYSGFFIDNWKIESGIEQPSNLLEHNQLQGLQGGSLSERYHLTFEELNRISKPLKKIEDTPYTIQVEDLNRPLIFTSNNQVVNIEDTLVDLAAASGLTLYDFIAYFQGTGTHTINHPQGGEWTGTQGALVKGLCIDISGDSLWVIKQWVDNSVIANSHIQNTDTILDEGGANEITAAAIKTHVEDTDNPHDVTKEQVGLGNVDNTSDLDKPISTATQDALDLKADDSDLTAHIEDDENPHETNLQKAYNETALSEDALEKVIGVNSGGNVVEQNAISQTLLNQHTQSSTTGDTGANLLQPDFGVAIFTSEDMQAGSSYKGEIYLEIDNNHTGTPKIIDLFGIGIFNTTSAIPEIKGKLTFDIDFYNQAGNIITYRVSYGFVSAGLQFYDSKTSTIDNTVSADIELTVDCDETDNIYVNKAKIKRENLKGIL